MADWNSAQYLKFKTERTQPAVDLANRVPLAGPGNILDVGCGPGNSTQVLHAKFPNASILGIDQSQNMIDSARAACPEMKFMLCDAQTDLNRIGNMFDLVFSNACIQWIPNHPSLLRQMMALLNPGGVLAVQIPLQREHPVHQILQRLAGKAPWQAYFQEPRPFYTLAPEQYFDLLAPLSSTVSMWRTDYFHVLDSHMEILEWYRGTGLRPYLEVLPPDKQPQFEQAVLDAVKNAYPKQENGQILFRFPRFFFIAGK